MTNFCLPVCSCSATDNSKCWADDLLLRHTRPWISCNNSWLNGRYKELSTSMERRIIAPRHKKRNTDDAHIVLRDGRSKWCMSIYVMCGSRKTKNWLISAKKERNKWKISPESVFHNNTNQVASKSQFWKTKMSWLSLLSWLARLNCWDGLWCAPIILPSFIRTASVLAAQKGCRRQAHQANVL